MDDVEAHIWWPNGKLVALPAHVLNQDGDVECAPAADGERIGVLARLDLEGQVPLQLSVKSIPDVTCRHKLAFLAGKGGRVNQECHPNCGLLHLAETS